jgi:predicted amidohydrolase
VVDPWGKVLLDMQEEVGVEVIELDLSLIEKVRKILPAIDNIRHDLYKVI